MRFLQRESRDGEFITNSPPSMSSVRWKVTPAGPCSSSCGLGLAVQLVTCVQIHQGKEVLLEERLCPVAEKPLASVPCVVRVCSYEWSFSEWSEVWIPVQFASLKHAGDKYHFCLAYLLPKQMLNCFWGCFPSFPLLRV